MFIAYLHSLFSSTDKSVDSIIVAGIGALFAMCAIQGYSVAIDHKEIHPLEFGGGCAAIIGAIGGGKAVRDRFSPVGDPAVVLPDSPQNVADAAKTSGQVG